MKKQITLLLLYLSKENTQSRPKSFLKKYLLIYSLIALSLTSCNTKNEPQETTFKIDEERFKRSILEKLQNIPQDTIQEQANQLAENIRSGQSLFRKVPWIEEATEDASIAYDPATKLEEDILDSQGNILFSKGTKINPLKGGDLDEGILFFDGENPRHVAWAESQEGEFKWILTNGNPLKLQEQKNRTIFFDQGGVYSNKFFIKKIPSRITQKGEKLLIEEIHLKP